MKTKPKILLITPGFAADEADSRCIPALQDYVSGLAEHLAKFEFEVLTLHYPFQAGRYLWHDVPITALALPNRTRWQRMTTVFRALRWFQQHPERDAFIGFHAFWLTHSAIIGRVLAALFRKNYLVTIMGQDALPANQYHRWLQPPAGSLVAPSAFAAAQYAAHRGVEPQVIPWGFGPILNEPARPRTLDILAVGSLIPLKNFELLLRTLLLLRKAWPHLRAEIIGEGPEFARLDELIQIHQLGDHCQLRGALPRDQVLARMSEGRVLVHPSRFESFGHVFVEALGKGMAIVSQPVGIAEASESWRLASTASEFANALHELLSNPPDHHSRWPYPLEDVYRSYAGVYSPWIEE